MSIRIRPMRAEDVETVHDLCVQLGYAPTLAEVAARFREMETAAGESLFVAQDEADAVGFLHLHEMRLLEDLPHLIVQALVVDEARRGAGIGGALLDFAEARAAELGFAEVRLSSQTHRAASHAHYRARGYEMRKESLLFRKRVETTAPAATGGSRATTTWKSVES